MLARQKCEAYFAGLEVYVWVAYGCLEVYLWWMVGVVAGYRDLK